MEMEEKAADYIRNAVRTMNEHGDARVVRMSALTAADIGLPTLLRANSVRREDSLLGLRLFTSHLIPRGTIVVDDGSPDGEWARIEREGI